MAHEFRALRLRSRDEFDYVVEHLTHEAYRARTHWDAWVAMEEAFTEYWEEFNLAPAFWELTRRAHQDILILRLGRLYDTHPSSTSLGNLLMTLKEKTSLAGTILPTKAKKLTTTKLDRDMKSVSTANPSVNKLVTIRNQYLAHRGPQHVTKGTFAGLPKLEKQHLSHLLKNAIRIMTTYRRTLGYHTLIWGQQEAREFNEVLTIIRAGKRSKPAPSR